MSPKIKARPADISQACFEQPLAPTLKRILVARNIVSDNDLDQRLASLEPPSSLKGIDTAAVMLATAIKQQKSVLVCGDYDADGATATALLIRVLKASGLKQIDFLVPNRFDFGYGLSPELVEVASQSKPDLIITVDNGISSITGVARAKELGIQVLVTDHHLPGNELPQADAMVNPNQPGCHFPCKNLAGVGVVFYVLIALRALLREQQWFTENNIQEPRLEKYLDIVALGTVADLVPLDRLNRVLVSQGLKLLRTGHGNPGIQALFEVSGRDFSQAMSSDLGFAIAPRINAAGRLDDISEGIRCLLSDDPGVAYSHARQLHQINQERRQIQDQMLADAERALATENHLDIQQFQETVWGYCCFNPDWHQGLVGLVAARVKERIHRPVIAFAADENSKELKGSARSIKGLHVRDCLDRIDKQHPGMIKKFGGHAMAAGLTIDSSDLDAFSKAFDENVQAMLSEDDLEATIWFDGELDQKDFDLDFARQLENLIPWGQAVPEPQFQGVFEVVEQRWLKESHLKFKLKCEDIDELVDAIWFQADALDFDEADRQIRAVYRLSINRYMGRESLQLMIQHAEKL